MPEAPTFDFDPLDSQLRLGIEVEYPKAPSWDEQDKFTRRGSRTRSESDTIRSDLNGNWLHGGNAGWDGTVGIEIDSQVLDIQDAWKWYADTIESIEDEYNIPHAPTGLVSGNTAGLHIHLSPLTRQQARTLYEISSTSWAQAFFCSSIISEDGNNEWPVFRCGDMDPTSGYCRFQGPDSTSRYNVVNNRGGDHWEWRLPEPMTTENFKHVIEFLLRFEDDPELATQYAQEVLDSGDETVTSIKRAEMCGIDIDAEVYVARSPATESEQFYRAVEDGWGYPEIHRVTMDDREYYLFESRLNGVFEVDGIEFRDDDVLQADELEPVTQSRAEEIRRAFNRRGNDTRHTPATDYVKDIVKKKKGGSA